MYDVRATNPSCLIMPVCLQDAPRHLFKIMARYLFENKSLSIPTLINPQYDPDEYSLM